MTEKRSSTGDIDGVTLERVVEAPRAVVFKAWTDPNHVGEWWGPHHFTNRVRKWEARPGGAIDLDMIGPDGTAHQMTGRFKEVSEPDRLVFTSAVPGPDGKPIFEVHNVISFSDSGAATTITVQATIIGRTEGAAQYLKGMEAGWGQSLERLDAYATRIGGAAK